MTKYCEEHEKIYETHCPDCELVDLVTTPFEEEDMPESADVTEKCPTCGGSRKVDQDGISFQDYKDAGVAPLSLKPCPDCAEKPDHIAEEKTDPVLIRNRLAELESASEKPGQGELVTGVRFELVYREIASVNNLFDKDVLKLCDRIENQKETIIDLQSAFEKEELDRIEAYAANTRYSEQITAIITTLAKLYHSSAGENIIFRMLPESVMAEVKKQAKEK